jgi:hypothetical protein
VPYNDVSRFYFFFISKKYINNQGFSLVNLQEIDGWYRQRLRMVIWKQWKRIKTKCANLQKLGIRRKTSKNAES